MDGGGVELLLRDESSSTTPRRAIWTSRAGGRRTLARRPGSLDLRRDARVVGREFCPPADDLGEVDRS